MIESLDEEKLSMVKSETWKNGKRRCETVGIHSVSIEDAINIGINIKKFSWSEEHGDPFIYLAMDEKIKKISHDNFEFSLSIEQ